MQCLRPLYILNPRYRKDDKLLNFYRTAVKSGAINSLPEDVMIYVPCGKCVACKKNLANNWKVRLYFEYKLSCKKAYFITFTFSDKYYSDAVSNVAPMIRAYCERYRKKYKRSLKHWFVTELGDESGRFHLHGILFDPLYTVLDRDMSFMEQVPEFPWPYGISFFGTCSVGSISYCVKYMLKQHPIDENFKPKVFASPGLGAAYADRPLNYYHEDDLGDFSVDVEGQRCSLPRYLQQKMFADDWLKSIRKIKEYSYDPFARESRYFLGVDKSNAYGAQLARDRYFTESLQRGASSRLFPKPIDLGDDLENYKTFLLENEYLKNNFYAEITKGQIDDALRLELRPF